jgi:hypothetical protein
MPKNWLAHSPMLNQQKKIGWLTLPWQTSNTPLRLYFQPWSACISILPFDSFSNIEMSLGDEFSFAFATPRGFYIFSSLTRFLSRHDFNYDSDYSFCSDDSSGFLQNFVFYFCDYKVAKKNLLEVLALHSLDFQSGQPVTRALPERVRLMTRPLSILRHPRVYALVPHLFR